MQPGPDTHRERASGIHGLVWPGRDRATPASQKKFTSSRRTLSQGMPSSFLRLTTAWSHSVSLGHWASLSGSPRNPFTLWGRLCHLIPSSRLPQA